jgi:hypothetical protein
MTPYLAAAAVYEREPCARSFEHDLFLHLMHGYVISTPEVFAMVRPVRSSWGLELLRTPSETDSAGDCWWVWLAAGDVRKLFDWLPPKKWVAWECSNTPRFWEYDRLRRLFLARHPSPAA